MKKLIITADDYGYLDHIDNAILDLARKYRISSVSCFANLPYDVLKPKIDKLLSIKEELKLQGKELGIGLHFTITSGEPLKGESSLTAFYTGSLKFRKLKHHSTNLIKEEDIIKELQAQRENLIRALEGRAKLDHISCHHNICYFKKSYFKAYVSTIGDFNEKVPIRSPLRWVKFNKFLRGEKAGRKALRRRGLRNRFQGSLSQLAYTWRKGMLKLYQIANSNSVRFPTFFFSEFYKNPTLEMANLLTSRLKDSTHCEVIAHVSKGYKSGGYLEEYHGINDGYFSGREEEFYLFSAEGERKPNFYNETEILLDSYFNHLNVS